jgi:holin-like protein
MIVGFFLVLLCQLVSEVLSRGLGLPAPGPIVGLASLIAALALYRRWRPFDDEALAASELGKAARGLLAARGFAVGLAPTGSRQQAELCGIIGRRCQR